MEQNMTQIDMAQFEIDMLTFCNMYTMPYDVAAREARKEYKETSKEVENESCVADDRPAPR